MSYLLYKLIHDIVTPYIIQYGKKYVTELGPKLASEKPNSTVIKVYAAIFAP